MSPSQTRAASLVGSRIALMDPVALFRAGYGFDPLPWQHQYLREQLNTLILKGRQVGASTCAGCLAVKQARYVPRSLAAIVSPSQKQSTEVKVKASMFAQALGEDVVSDNATTIKLSNGSRIISLPGSPKSVRGWTADLLIIDEAAFLDPDTFLAARATAATGGRIVVQSTPAGPYGPFYDLWESAGDDWARYHVSSEQVGIISDEFLAGERATLDEDEYAQEYLGVFRVPGLGLVDPAALEKIRVEEPESPWAALR